MFSEDKVKYLYLWLAIGLVLLAVAVFSYILIKRKRSLSSNEISEPQEVLIPQRDDSEPVIPEPEIPEPEIPEPEIPEPEITDLTALRLETHDDLVNAYCLVCKELDDYRDWNSYRQRFNQFGPFIQLLLGSKRCFERSEKSMDEIVAALKIMIDNFSLRNKINENGFVVENIPSTYFENEIRSDCQKVSDTDIRVELERQIGYLMQQRGFFDFKGIAKRCSHLLYSIINDIEAGETRSLISKIKKLETSLELHGCYALFADDEITLNSEAIRIDFINDNKWAIEVPGLYSKDNGGNYHCIGGLAGTVRGE